MTGKSKKKTLLGVLTLECLLDSRPNSAGVILLRTMWASLLIFVLALLLKNMVRIWDAKVCAWRPIFLEIASNTSWLGAIAAAAYAAFYTRFAAQWSYLANLYNQIKQMEVTYPDCSEQAVERARQEALDDWRIALIDDAETLHLCGKKCFASVILRWAKRPGMKKRFSKGLQGEERRFAEILGMAARAWNVDLPELVDSDSGPPSIS